MSTDLDITDLLRRAGAGDQHAHSTVMSALYDEIKKVAHAELGRGGVSTLNTTALVHETYLRVVDRVSLPWPDRHRFLAYLARAMRSVLVDRARRALAKKRGADLTADDEEAAAPATGLSHETMLAIDQSLISMAAIDPLMVDVVELHIFAGLEFAEIATFLGTSERSTYRIWRKARLLLQGAMDPQ